MSSPISVHNQEGKVVGTLELPKALEGPVETPTLWQAVRMYLANQRQGTSDTKTRAEVRGGGRKPWAQKHTGRARAGTIRSPLWRKGGVTFGPHPREHRYELPREVRRRALTASLRAKAKSQSIWAIDSLTGLEPKTKALAQLLKRIQVSKKVLLVVDQPDPLLTRISRNLSQVTVRPVRELNCYDVLNHSQVVVTSEAFKQLEGLVG